MLHALGPVSHPYDIGFAQFSCRLQSFQLEGNGGSPMFTAGGCGGVALKDVHKVTGLILAALGVLMVPRELRALVLRNAGG